MIKITEKTAAELVEILETDIKRYLRLNEEMAIRGSVVNFDLEIMNLKWFISELTNQEKGEE